MRKAVETIVAVWLVLGWVVGSTLVLLGLGWAIVAVLDDGDFFDMIEGLTLMCLGVLAVNIGWAGSRFLVKTVGLGLEEK